MKSILSVILFACLICSQPAGAQLGSGVMTNEEGWIVESDFAFTSPMSALIRPDDGLIFLGARTGNLFRSDAQGNSEQLVSTTQVAGVGYDPATGAIFLSEDFPGNIKRVDIDPDTGAASAQNWVTGFHSGDDDSAGIAAVPSDYTGTLLLPGDMVSTDRGFNGPNMIYTWSSDTPENEILVLDDNGSLVDPFDIAVKGQTIAIADFNEGIKLLNDDGSVSPLVTAGVSFMAAQGVVFDTRSDDLLVLDTALDGVYRVDMTTGQATAMFSQLGSSGTNWGGVNIHDDGSLQRIVVSVTEGDRVLVFSGPDFLFIDGFESP
ncbi:MAG: hypothetical protein LC637_07950 [Xanthomonadaceae bacterium]|nr:hypothetical protein [Xanthomonadaceae bacterium]